MKRKQISQAEARRLQRELRELRQKYDILVSRYGFDFPGDQVERLALNGEANARLETANTLGFQLVMKKYRDNLWTIRAVKA